MMYRLLLSALVVTATMQTSPAIQTATSPASKNNQQSSTTNIPAATNTKAGDASPAASAPIIKLHGFCPAGTSASSKTGAACETIVTKQQFDTIVNALNAIGAPLLQSQYRTVAEGYTTTLLNYEAAKKAGVERDPRFQEVMRLARMRAMGDMYNAMMQEKARKVSPDEIQAYYKNNADRLEELTLRRIVLVKVNSANLKDEEFTAKARKIANDIHDRAAKGEDMDKLEKEGSEMLGINEPPTTKMGPVRRGMYATEQEDQLFALKPGEVTGIMEQPSTLLIFKLESRQVPTLDKAKDEIVRKLIQEHLEKQAQSVKNGVKVEFNEQYVGPATPAGGMPLGKLNAQNQTHGSAAPKPVPVRPESPK